MFDREAILIRTDHPDYDIMFTIKINNVAINPNKVTEFGDPECLVNVSYNFRTVSKHKK